MKTIMLFLTVFCGAAIADQYVNPYLRSDGSYVQGHMRSSPNNSQYDNWTSKGNSNPYTGQRGYSDPTPSYGTVYRAPNPSSYLNGPSNPYYNR